MSCPACGEACATESAFCHGCGARLVLEAPAWTPCRICARPVEADASFCMHCGGRTRGCFGCGELEGGLALCPKCRPAWLICHTCGLPNRRDDGACVRCRAVLDLPADFSLHPNEYEFAGDRDGLNTLRSMRPVTAAADYVARKLGKPFIESQFIGSGIRVSSEQFPKVQRAAVLAATVLGLPQLPEIYISGDKGWQSDTYGTETDSFVVLGSFLARQLSEIELLWVVAHELGHIRSGHAMYRTVAQILGGTQQQGVMSHGLFGLLDIGKLLSLPIELPLLSWVRQSEVTADAAAMVVVGDHEVARRILITMALRSADMMNQINLDAYLRQQEEMDTRIVKLSEYVSQNTPYVATRLRLMSLYVQSPEFQGVRARLQGSRDLRPTLEAIDALRTSRRRPRAGDDEGGEVSPPRGEATPADNPQKLRGTCPQCGHGWSVARDRVPAQGNVALRCSHCRSTFPVTSESPPRTS